MPPSPSLMMFEFFVIGRYQVVVGRTHAEMKSQSSTGVWLSAGITWPVMTLVLTPK